MLIAIEKQIELIKAMSNHKEKTLNDLINTHQGIPLLPVLCGDYYSLVP